MPMHCAALPCPCLHPPARPPARLQAAILWTAAQSGNYALVEATLMAGAEVDMRPQVRVRRA